MSSLTRTLAGTGTTGEHTHGSSDVLNARSVMAQLTVEAVGATPTMDWILEGSVDGVNWVTVSYITDVNNTPAAAASTVTDVGVYQKFLYPGAAGTQARFFNRFRVRTTANTNVTYSCILVWQEAGAEDARDLPAPGSEGQALAVVGGAWAPKDNALADVLANGTDADAQGIDNVGALAGVTSIELDGADFARAAFVADGSTVNQVLAALRAAGLMAAS